MVKGKSDGKAFAEKEASRKALKLYPGEGGA